MMFMYWLGVKFLIFTEFCKFSLSCPPAPSHPLALSFFVEVIPSVY